MPDAPNFNLGAAVLKAIPVPDSMGVPFHGPYEDAAIALIGLIRVVVEGQPPEIRKALWEMYLQDVKDWRSFWQQFWKTIHQ